MARFRIHGAGLLASGLALALASPGMAEPVVQPLPGASGSPGTIEQTEVVQPIAPIRPVAGQIHNAAAIRSFLQKLPGAPGRTLTIVQIGDSHTAGDMITNGWREAWQAKFGRGGRGPLAVGKPYRGYITWGVTANQSAGWTTNALFGRQHMDAGPALGLSGFTQTASHAGETLSLSADTPDYTFDSFGLCGLTGPDKGDVSVLLGSVAQSFSFSAPEPGAACFDVVSPRLVSSVFVTTADDRTVNLTSWETHRRSGGLVLANMGVVGSRFLHFERNDDRVLGLELRRAHPDLLVIAFGTNEGFDPTLSLDEAEASMRIQIRRIRHLLGYEVPILLLGPPDSESKRPEIALLAKPETVACGDGLYVPGNLALIRRLQMRLADDMNLAFWDWQRAMGGPCASSRWVSQGLQRGDHVHFTVIGGRMLGEAIAADLDKARADMTGR
jgi:hypothetical protein